MSGGVRGGAGRWWRLVIIAPFVCAALVATYAVEAPTCERQVIAFLEDLRAEGLLVVYPERPAGQPGA